MQTQINLNPPLITEVRRSGQGVPLVLCHGGPAAQDYLEGLADLFPDGFEILRYDQRGGGSSKGPGPYTLAQLVSDLEQIRLRLGFERWIVAGHSWGAFLALAYAAAHSEATQALIQISGTALDRRWHSVYQQNRRKALTPAEQIEFLHLRQDFDSACAGGKRRSSQRLKALNFKADLWDPERVPELLRLHNYPVQRQIQTALLEDWNATLQDVDFETAVSQLSCPLLCLHGEADPRPATGSRHLAEHLGGQFVLLEQAGHYPWLEQAERTATILKDFLTPLR